MNITIDPIYLNVNLIAAIVCAKWAMDLGFGQIRQLLWGIAGFALPSLILLILYVRLIRHGSGLPKVIAEVPAQSLFHSSELELDKTAHR